MSSIEFLTPVGPGHDVHVTRLERKLMLVRKSGLGPFSCATWSYLHDTHGTWGRGKTRNLLLDQCRSDWVFWLDADDDLPSDILRELGQEKLDDVDALWGAIYAYGLEEDGYREGQVWPFTHHELLHGKPFHGLQIGYLVRREVQDKERWREDLVCGEDYDMYLRLWRKYRCKKINRKLYLNCRGRHSHGPRAATGADWNRAVARLLAEERASLQQDRSAISSP